MLVELLMKKAPYQCLNVEGGRRDKAHADPPAKSDIHRIAAGALCYQ